MGRTQSQAAPVTGRDRQERRFLEIGGKRLPFLRWSLLRMVVGAYHLTTHWQVGDGREEALAAYVEQSSRKGDLDDVINAIDDFCYHRSLMMNVGDEKGPILERAIRRAQPARLLELGTYCGYSALRMIRAMPQHARLWSIEFNPANADVARRIWDHAGVAGRATLVVGTLGKARPSPGSKRSTASPRRRSTWSSSTTTRPRTCQISSGSSTADGYTRVRLSLQTM